VLSRKINPVINDQLKFQTGNDCFVVTKGQTYRQNISRKGAKKFQNKQPFASYVLNFAALREMFYCGFA
jgi:hypothetical protein